MKPRERRASGAATAKPLSHFPPCYSLFRARPPNSTTTPGDRTGRRGVHTRHDLVGARTSKARGPRPSHAAARAAGDASLCWFDVYVVCTSGGGARVVARLWRGVDARMTLGPCPRSLAPRLTRFVTQPRFARSWRQWRWCWWMPWFECLVLLIANRGEAKEVAPFGCDRRSRGRARG